MEYFNMSYDEGNWFGFQRNGNSSLILDNERGELVRGVVMKPGPKVGNAEKALLALRNHSEAERRRRERINAHLATLRTLIPGTNKVIILYYSSTFVACFDKCCIDYTSYLFLHLFLLQGKPKGKL